MIFITVKWTIRPERSHEWLSLVDEFTRSTRAEQGNLFFEWYRSVDDPDVFLLVEAFADGAAGGVHVQSDHFKAAMAWMPEVVASTPEIVNFEIPQQGWSQMAEVQPR